MDKQIRLGRRSVDLIDGGMQSAQHILIGVFAEPNMAIADLHEREGCGGKHVGGVSGHMLVHRDLGKVEGFRNSADHSEQNARPGPGHALQKATTVNVIVRLEVSNPGGWGFIPSWRKKIEAAK